jgi:hypothetical protein
MNNSIKSVWNFAVEGVGLFPFDMLRHDSCHPLHETDSFKIEQTIGRGLELRTIAMRGYTLMGPTEGRWESFGWKVTGKEKKRL